jgi:glutamyl-tRNA reductase
MERRLSNRCLSNRRENRRVRNRWERNVVSTIAFIGLGIMGSPMAVHLVRAGHTVAGYNRSPEKARAPTLPTCRPC